MIFIKDAGDENKAGLIEEIRRKNELIDMAGRILEQVSQDEKTRAIYQQRRKWYLDKVSSEKFLINKGGEEGREEVAKNLLAMGMDIEAVAKGTGLSKERIQSLK